MKELRGVALPDDVEKPVPASQAVRERLEALWKDTRQLRRLYAIARTIVKKSGSIRRRNVEGTKDQPYFTKQLIDDLVFEAVVRVLEGRRKWDIDKQPDPHVYLGGVIGSLWTHFAAAEKARKEREKPAGSGRLTQVTETDAYDWRTRRPPTPLELLIAKEEEEEYQLLRADFAAEFDPDKKAGRLALDFLALTQDEIYEPGEQARLLGITMDEIYTLRARVKRVLERFITQRKKKP